jgi:hypothetical protein
VVQTGKNRRLFFWWLFHRLTTPLRVLPDFLIIGTMKGGTTSLFQYLAKHSSIRPPFRKEIKYFDLHYQQGQGWYRAHFPMRFRMNGGITGEATPYYMFHPLAPADRGSASREVDRHPAQPVTGRTRIATIWCVGRATCRSASGWIGRRRLSGEWRRSKPIRLIPPSTPALFLLRRAYGRYAEQIKNWLGLFPRDQMLFLSSEELYASPATLYAKAIEFLGLPHWEPQGFKVFKQGVYEDIPASMRARLTIYFKPYNYQLYDLVGNDFGWE